MQAGRAGTAHRKEIGASYALTAMHHAHATGSRTALPGNLTMPQLERAANLAQIRLQLLGRDPIGCHQGFDHGIRQHLGNGRLRKTPAHAILLPPALRG